MVGCCWACDWLEPDWISLGAAVEHGCWGTEPDGSYWQPSSASQVTWASPQCLQQLQDPSDPRVLNVKHCLQVVEHRQLFRPFLHLIHEDLVILVSHTLTLEIVLDSICDGDDVHAALYRAISLDGHGTHPTQMDQNDDRKQTTRLQGESFILPEISTLIILNGESFILPA